MNALRVGVAVLVAIVWAVIYMASVFDPNLNAPPELSGVMLAVVTWLFGREFKNTLKERARDAAKAVLDGTDEEERPRDES